MTTSTPREGGIDPLASLHPREAERVTADDVRATMSEADRQESERIDATVNALIAVNRAERAVVEAALVLSSARTQFQYQHDSALAHLYDTIDALRAARSRAQAARAEGEGARP